MQEKSVYVLRNKDNGKWFYEAEFGGMVNFVPVEVDDLEELMDCCTRNYSNWKDLAESWCESHSERDKLNLEVVEIRVKTAIVYEEVPCI